MNINDQHTDDNDESDRLILDREISNSTAHCSLKCRKSKYSQ